MPDMVLPRVLFILAGALYENRTDNEAEREKLLLINLSTVCKELHNGIANDDKQFAETSFLDHAYSSNACACTEHAPCQNCIKNVAETLVLLLTLENEFVQHSSANALFALSVYIEEHEEKWKWLLQFLWNCFQRMCSSLDVHLFCNAYEFEPQYSNWLFLTSTDTHFCNYIKSKMASRKCSNSPDALSCLHKSCDSASLLMRLLQRILKACHLKQDRFMFLSIEISESYIVDVAWTILGKFQIFSSCSINSSCETLTLGMEMLLGSLLQFLCSLLNCQHPRSNMISEALSSEQRPLIVKFVDLVSALSVTCLAPHGHPQDTCISEYLRHKLLVLMTRLLDFCAVRNTFVLYLNLLQKHAEDLLSYPLLDKPDIKRDVLVGSPFSTARMHWKSDSTCDIHLQSYAIYLLLRCSFFWIKVVLKDPTEGSCSFAIATKDDLTSHLNDTCLNSQNIFLVLVQWLMRQASCSSRITDEFRRAFLELFMNEDDMMFRMLLLLFEIPDILTFIGNQSFENEESMGICVVVLESLKPNVMFFSFLKKICYDPSVIIDYLISKGSGALCLQYFLRCLKALCSSWPECIKRKHVISDSAFSGYRTGNSVTEYSPKRLKLTSALQNSMLDLEVTLEEREEGTQSLFAGNSDVDEPNIGSIIDCLYFVWDSIEKLHRKSLFPYNPSPLLKRLKCFLTLCDKLSLEEKR